MASLKLKKACAGFALLSALILLATLPANAGQIAPTQPRSLAFELAQIPSSALPNLSSNSNEKISLKQLQGYVVYVDFWASWCGPCRQSFPFMNQMQQKYHEVGLRIVAINLDQDFKDAQSFLKKNPAQFLLAMDPEGRTPAQYEVKGMPSSYLIGRDGQLISIHVGFKLEDRSDIESQIRVALGLAAQK